MAIKNIIANGIGFAAGSVKWIVTHGLSIGAAQDATATLEWTAGDRALHWSNAGQRLHWSTGRDTLHWSAKQ